MRMSEQQIRSILRIVTKVAGPSAKVRVPGSRLRDEATGGDLDLLVEPPEPTEMPAELAARLSAEIAKRGWI